MSVEGGEMGGYETGRGNQRNKSDDHKQNKGTCERDQDPNYKTSLLTSTHFSQDFWISCGHFQSTFHDPSSTLTMYPVKHPLEPD